MGTMSGRSGKKIESCILYCSYHRCIGSFFILNPFMTYLNSPVNVVFAVPLPLRAVCSHSQIIFIECPVSTEG